MYIWVSHTFQRGGGPEHTALPIKKKFDFSCFFCEILFIDNIIGGIVIFLWNFFFCILPPKLTLKLGTQRLFSIFPQNYGVKKNQDFSGPVRYFDKILFFKLVIFEFSIRCDWPLKNENSKNDTKNSFWAVPTAGPYNRCCHTKWIR